MRLAVILVIAAVATTGTGCVPLEADTTAWLRHVKTPATVTQSPAPVDRLIRELNHSALPDDAYTPAEQIAGHAIHELRHGNDADAALLLSIASYRYHQQALLAVNKGSAQTWRIRPEMQGEFADYVHNEATLFNEQNFQDELHLMRDRLFGVEMAARRHDAYVAQLAQGGKEDKDFVERLSKFTETISNRPERLVHERLATAYLARLAADDRGWQEARNYAAYYLAATPIDRFRLAALDQARIPFKAELIRNLVPRMQVLRDKVRASLTASNHHTRSNAAAALGLAGDPTDIELIELLESRLQIETTYQVVDSLRFALVHLGRTEYIADLIARAGTARLEDQDHALLLLQWLPEEPKAAFDEQLLVGLARGQAGVTDFSRVFAVAILRDIARQRSLSHESVVALLELTGSPDKEIARAATRTVGELGQLGAAECKAFYAEYPSARPALISRLGDVASMRDLEFLREVHARNITDPEDEDKDNDNDNDSDQKDAIRSEVVTAVANIPGAASRQLLQRWFIQTYKHDATRLQLIIVLAARDDADRSALDQVRLSRAKRLLVDVAFGGDALARADVRGLAIHDLMQAAVLARIFERHDLVPALWRLSSYRDHSHYPVDAVVRRLALSAVFRNEMSKQSTALARAGK